MARSARRLWSFDEFLALDDGTDTRYELFECQIVAMAAASDVHGALVTCLARRIGNALRPRREDIAEAGIVPPERADSWYQADLTVTCAGLTGRQFVAEPILIVEVLSPTTAVTDRERKLPDYRTIPSLQDILVVSSTERRIEHFRREPDGWKIHDLRNQGAPRRQALDLTLDLGELYADLFDASGDAGSASAKSSRVDQLCSWVPARRRRRRNFCQSAPGSRQTSASSVLVTSRPDRRSRLDARVEPSTVRFVGRR